MKYKEADLDYIFIRAELPNGHWGNLSLTKLSDEQFVNWATKRFGVEIKDASDVVGKLWTPQHKIDFLNDMSNRLGQPAVVMIKRDARDGYKKDKTKN